MSLSTKSKANNTAGLVAVRFLVAFSQPTHIVVSSLQLIHSPLVSLTDFLGSCVQAGCKLTARFSSLSSPLSSTLAFSRLTAGYHVRKDSPIKKRSFYPTSSLYRTNVASFIVHSVASFIIHSVARSEQMLTT